MAEAVPQPLLLPPSVPEPTAAAPDVVGVSGAPGGPLLPLGFVSPLISVSSYQSSCIKALAALQAELNDAYIQGMDDDDLLVDDLKIISEEELINSALKKVVEEKINASMEEQEKESSSSDPGPKKGSFEGTHGQGKEAESGSNDNTSEGGHISQERAENPESNENSACGTNDTATKGGHNSQGRVVKQDKEKCKRPKKRGRPFDKVVRAAAWGKDEEKLYEEPLYTRLKMERELGRKSCTLQSLSAKDRQGPGSVRLEINKKLQALNYFVSPIKDDSMALVSAFEHIPAYEVVLWIEVARYSKKQKAQGFLVLGSQMLTALRDKIYCLTDRLMAKMQSYVPSGYFHIENFFYNDMRHPTAIDYSAPIRNWRWEQGLPDAYAADMETTQFLDLDCRIGKQYVYCHQGACRHAMVVKDVRLVHKEDIQDASLYPLLRSPYRVNHRKCTICEIYRAKKVTYDDKMAPQSPCFFCDYCYFLLHYSQDGTLVYSDFKVYDYYHD